MYFTGHTAVAYIVAAGPALATRRLLDVRQALIPALVGALTPDLIDKPLYFLGVFGHGRALGHSLFFWAAAFFIWRKLSDQRPRPATSIYTLYRWWFAGLSSHLVMDLLNDVHRGLEYREILFRAWMGWPLVNGEMARIAPDLGEYCTGCHSSLEMAAFALALAIGLAAHLQLKRLR